jgi:hypothetical protein
LNGSLIVNPWNTEEMANAINTAITMSEADKEANYLKLLDYVEKYTAAHWVRFCFYLFLSSSLSESQFRETSAEAVSIDSQGVTFVAELQRLLGEQQAIAEARIEAEDAIGLQVRVTSSFSRPTSGRKID